MSLMLYLARLPLEIIYGLIFIFCASAVYITVARRVPEEQLSRRTVDTLFFVILGAASLIWVLSKLAPPSA